jgi:Tfp pilus assembly protein PilO
MSPNRPFWLRRLAPLALALAAANLLLLTWTLPRTHRLRNAAARAAQAQRAAHAQRAVVAELRGRAAAIRSNGQDLRRFHEQLVGAGQQDVLAALQDVEAMVRAPGLRPGGRAFSRDAVRGAPVERIAIRLPLEGDYAQLVGFLRAVERSERFLTVDRVALRGEEGGARLEVELSTYVARPAEAGEEGRDGP